MTVAAGSRLGPYEITGKLGEGGMGEVWRASDPRLGRDVALKLIPEAFTREPERLARFEREAKVLASLNHPNIAQVYGLESHGDAFALVMELVEGPTLAERQAAARLSLQESLSIARQIAEALEEAHEKGVVHRDLKPQNVKAPPDGRVKVLDFGLAKAIQPPAGASVSPTQLAVSPTLSIAATQLGVVLGSAAYMSPEQARGLDVDRRADVWAFGVVVFEMLSGRRLFEGETLSDTVAAVLRQEIDWSVLPAETPPAIRHLLGRCLTRDRRQRLHDVGDARLEIEEALAGGASPVTVPMAAARRGVAGRVGLALGIVGVAVGIAGFVWGSSKRPSPSRAFALSVALPRDVELRPTGGDGGPVVVSPNGRAIAFVAQRGRDALQLWVRDIDGVDARPLAGTDGAGHPFWAADGSALGFFSDGHLRTISAAGGPVATLAEAPEARGGTWNASGTILFAPDFIGPIYRISSDGGRPAPASELDTAHHEDTNRYPQFLPDGKHFLFLGRVGWKGTLYVSQLGSRTRKRLVDDVANAAYSAGQLLFVRDGALMAQPFDADSLSLRGRPRVLVEHLLFDERFSVGTFSASADGVLAYQTGRDFRRAQLTWVERNGERHAVPIEPSAVSGSECPPVLASDASQALVCRPQDSGLSADVWQVDLRGGTQRPLTHGRLDLLRPLWGPDGTTVYFGTIAGADVTDKAAIFVRRAGEDPTALYSDNNAAGIFPSWISADGRQIVFHREETGHPDTMQLLDVGPPARVRLLVGGKSAISWSSVSPDGRWLAYESGELGRQEVFAAHFPTASGAVRVSMGGGGMPLWRGDGRELFFTDLDNWIVATEVEQRPDGELTIGKQARLFQVLGLYAVTRDGQRFLVEEPLPQTDVSPIIIRSGWEREKEGASP